MNRLAWFHLIILGTFLFVAHYYENHNTHNVRITLLNINYWQLSNCKQINNAILSKNLHKGWLWISRRPGTIDNSPCTSPCRRRSFTPITPTAPAATAVIIIPTIILNINNRRRGGYVLLDFLVGFTKRLVVDVVGGRSADLSKTF